uniref:Uncharacterized protein n=1 Tax=Romanomermis culicivorax TaxID=13658 RepID=A0A915I3D9_ROMCU
MILLQAELREIFLWVIEQYTRASTFGKKEVDLKQNFSCYMDAISAFTICADKTSKERLYGHLSLNYFATRDKKHCA